MFVASCFGCKRVAVQRGDIQRVYAGRIHRCVRGGSFRCGLSGARPCLLSLVHRNKEQERPNQFFCSSFRTMTTVPHCVVNSSGAGGFRLAAESGGRKGERTFEGAVKGRFRLIANLRSDLRNTIASGFEHLRAELKPPACEVTNGG